MVGELWEVVLASPLVIISFCDVVSPGYDDMPSSEV